MKEFGYRVSNDYEKLWTLIKRQAISCILHEDLSRNGGMRSFGMIRSHQNPDVKYLILSVHNGRIGRRTGTKEAFIKDCGEYHLTFIDPEPETCEMILVDDDTGTWECSKCGELWTLNDGTPKENGMEYCPKCGRKIIYKEDL